MEGSLTTEDFLYQPYNPKVWFHNSVVSVVPAPRLPELMECLDKALNTGWDSWDTLCRTRGGI